MHNRSSFVVSRSRYKIGSFAIDSIRAVFLHKSLPKNEFVCTNFYFSNRSRLLYLENNRRILLEARSITRRLQRMIHLSFFILILGLAGRKYICISNLSKNNRKKDHNPITIIVKISNKNIYFCNRNIKVKNYIIINRY